MLKSWLRVLVPQALVVSVILGFFFWGYSQGLTDKQTMTPSISVIAPFATSIVFAILVALGTVMITALAMFLAASEAKNYKLPIFWVAVSFLVQIAIVFLPIYLAIH